MTSYYLKTYALDKKEIPNVVNETLLKNLLDEYIDYYSFVKKEKQRINIIQFTDAVKNPNLVINNISFTIFNEKRDLKEEVELGIKTYVGAKDTYGSSKPNPQKELLKSDLKVYLRKYDNFSQAQKLYLSLTQCK